MEKIRHSIPPSVCMVYLDDTLVHVPSFDNALANLQLNPSGNCSTSKQASWGTLWDQMVSPLIQPSSKQFSSGGWFLPHRLKCEQFPGPNILLSALHCRRTFEPLRQAFIMAPVLALPDPTIPFILDTNASNNRVGLSCCNP
ncbi:hypothetical protein AAFF_G00308650 [Aldrovandia affinis]|uniref:Uncharacterized protein n=1 Tax=Aldrovandia affinis TaxID=143900 RepID=A0AAD7SNJ8_9TELE|nr:hypothetical protein AAFF_G00308650 [Aldrovandia affinis]